MQFQIANSIVKAATLEHRSWLGRAWDRLWHIDRIPLYHNVEVACLLKDNTPVEPGTLILLANGTTWLVTDFEQPRLFYCIATEPLTTETVQQMQEYQGDAVTYALACPDDQEERLFNRNAHV